jgi:dUTP pyrophosphatase
MNFSNNNEAYLSGIITSYIVDILLSSSYNANCNTNYYDKDMIYEITDDIKQILKYENNYKFNNEILSDKVKLFENKIKKIKLSPLIDMICKSYINEEDFYIKIMNYLNLNKNLKIHFAIGFFDANATISNDISAVKCRYISKSTFMTNFILGLSDIPYKNVNNNIIYTDSNCVDFLHNLYKNIDIYDNLFLVSNYQKYINFINWKLRITNLNNSLLNICKVYKDDINAIIPSKANFTDVGYDLTIIKKVKNLTNNTILYDTGIKIALDFGYYAEIAPRSSLSKSGYILANSVGIIENSYTGNLFIALTKIDSEMPDLILPFKCCQLIFKPQIFINIVESKTSINLDTIRGEGGFGSTNK